MGGVAADPEGCGNAVTHLEEKLRRKVVYLNPCLPSRLHSKGFFELV